MKIILLLIILIVVTLAYGLYYHNYVEPFNVMTGDTGLRLLGDNMNAKQCQQINANNSIIVNMSFVLLENNRG